MAAMVCDPARPSPTAAPMAPPPSARPPPVKAPASSMAFCVVAPATLSCLLSGALVGVLFGGELEVQQRQQGEDECLDDADEHVEQLPYHSQHRASHGELDRQGQQQGDHDAAGKEVAEEP